MAAGSTVDELARLRHLAETQRLLGSVAARNDESLQVLAERAQAITSADAATVELLDGDELVRSACSGSTAGTQGHRLRVATTISGRCVRLAVPMRCVDTEFDTRVDRSACRRLGIRSMVVVPIMRGDTAVGVMKVSSSHPDHFDESDVEVLQEMAGFIDEVVAPAHGLQLVGQPQGVGTTLADRGLLVECLEQACRGAEENGLALAVLVIRLNGTGSRHDRLLRMVAEALTKVVRGGDVLSRLGDEFVLICHAARESDAYGIMARVSAAVRRVADNNPEYQQVSASVGLAWRDEHRDPEALLGAAGAAVMAG